MCFSIYLHKRSQNYKKIPLYIERQPQAVGEYMLFIVYLCIHIYICTCYEGASMLYMKWQCVLVYCISNLHVMEHKGHRGSVDERVGGGTSGAPLSKN